jgi:ribonuclease BN (tRNA processing enzyme)
VLVHEVYSTAGFARRTPEWQAYHADAHTSTAELADVARRARPKLLVLYHQLYMGMTDEDLLREVREAGYAGAVVSARDLERYPD